METIELVSIGMPVYNDIKFIEKAINSIIQQSYLNFELILSDDCSSDGTEEICKKFASEDNRIIYVRQEKNIGISKNMEFLLSQAKGKYFMWAANDDEWHPDFIITLKNNLDNVPNAVSSFCAYAQIDEDGNIIVDKNYILEDYNSPTQAQRIKKLIKRNSDGFGYGLFKTEKIKGVKFPVWWWINKKCAYNNIFPTLCYYLMKGDYVIEKTKVLWHNRVKTNQNINHQIPFSNNFALCYLAFALRKLNLVYFSTYLIIKADKSFITAFKVLPRIFYSWFLIPVFYNFFDKYKRFKTDKTLMI